MKKFKEKFVKLFSSLNKYVNKIIKKKNDKSNVVEVIIEESNEDENGKSVVCTEKIFSKVFKILKNTLHKVFVKIKNVDWSKLEFNFNIKAQLLVGFIVPVAFVVIVGLSAYDKAKEGMIESYENTAAITINTQMDYLDFGLSLIRNDVIQFKLDTELQSYFGGLYHLDRAKSGSVKNKTNSSIVVKAGLNKFINNLYIIPKEEFEIISTDKTGFKGNKMPQGFYEEWSTTEEGKAVISSQITGWVSEHPELDKLTGYDPELYALSFITVFPNKSAALVVDINKEKILENLSSIDVTDGAVVGFITKEGKELLVKEDDNNIDISFYEQDFYKEIIDSEELSGTSYITYDKDEYLFIYKKSEETGATRVYLVPNSKVIASALAIKTLTFILVLISCIVAVGLGLGISLNITNNMNSIIKRLQRVAEGDLTVKMKVKGHSEFTTLNKHIEHMIENTRNLISNVNEIVDSVNTSAFEVEQVSDRVDQSSASIMSALEEIDAGVTQQADDSQSCLISMDTLSDAIESINNDINETSNNTNKSQDVVNASITTMDTLLSQTKDTIAITSAMSKDIESLSKETEAISKFVTVISDIAEQTNLLSLNASIEAARAGEAGRGFSVVAEEIRKLANGSNSAAKDINDVITKITKKMSTTAKTALHAMQIVNEQATTVDSTKDALGKINDATKEVLLSIEDTKEKAGDIEQGRISTLEAIANISAVSEETAASSSNVFAIAESQKEAVELLIKASNGLRVNTEELKKAISAFKTVDEYEDIENKEI